MAEVITEKDTAERIRVAARRLFARAGYDGVSVRDICREAGSNANAVHYHFSSKSGLFASILRDFGEEMLASARRALASTPRDSSEFRTRLQIFLEEMLSSFLENRDLILIVHRQFLKKSSATADDEVVLDPEALRVLGEYPRFLVEYFERARQAGILKAQADPEILAQLVMKPSVTMVLSCPMHENEMQTRACGSTGSTSIDQPEYRAHWIEQCLLFLLDGALA